MRHILTNDETGVILFNTNFLFVCHPDDRKLVLNKIPIVLSFVDMWDIPSVINYDS